MNESERAILDELLKLKDGLLSAWEVEFVKQLSHRTIPLSDMQAAKLKEIHERVIG